MSKGKRRPICPDTDAGRITHVKSKSKRKVRVGKIEIPEGLTPAVMAMLVAECKVAIRTAALELVDELKARQKALEDKMGEDEPSDNEKKAALVPDKCNKCGNTTFFTVYRKALKVLEITCDGCRDHWEQPFTPDDQGAGDGVSGD